MRIGLTYDLRTDYLKLGYTEEQVAEFDSEDTVASLERSIRACGHTPVRIGHARALIRRLARGDRWDLVFNIAEGVSGLFRESLVPALLDLHGIPYTFSDPFVCALTLDKALAKRLVREAGWPTPAFAVVRAPADARAVRLRYPLFAKPLGEGTGKGIDHRSRIDTPAELSRACRGLLRRFRQPVLVEEFLPGREFTVGILGTGRSARAIGTMEVEVKDPALRGIYSLETKERCEKLVRYGALPRGPLRREVEALALGAHCALGCRDASRADVRLDRRGRPSFMEINPLPGLHPTHSDLPMIATNAGMTHAELIGAIIRQALRRIEGR